MSQRGHMHGAHGYLGTCIYRCIGVKHRILVIYFSMSLYATAYAIAPTPRISFKKFSFKKKRVKKMDFLNLLGQSPTPISYFWWLNFVVFLIKFRVAFVLCAMGTLVLGICMGTIISSLSHHDLTIISSLSHHYLTIISPLFHKYLSVISPLSHHYLNMISP